jgi:hypothetical protein
VLENQGQAELAGPEETERCQCLIQGNHGEVSKETGNEEMREVGVTDKSTPKIHVVQMQDRIEN